jgi:hypothetical protein
LGYTKLDEKKEQTRNRIKNGKAYYRLTKCSFIINCWVPPLQPPELYLTLDHPRVGGAG